MKILVCGDKVDYCTEWYVVRAFRKMGHSVKWVSCFSPFKAFFQRRELLSLWSKYFNSLLRKEAVKFNPDVLFVFKGLYITPYTIQMIKKRTGTFAIHWMNDETENHNFQRYSKKNAHAFDFVFTTAEKYVERYRKMGVKAEYLPFACDPTIHRKVVLTKNETSRLASDLCFIGTYRKEREQLLLQLVSAKPHLNLKIWGGRWFFFRVDRRLRSYIQGSPIVGSEMVKAYNASKIVLNLHKKWDREDGMKANMRVFETTGCKSFLLTDKAVGMEDLYDLNKELVTYTSVTDLCDLIDYYLSAPEEREEIARRGQERAYKDHTYDHRAKRILDTL